MTQYSEKTIQLLADYRELKTREEQRLSPATEQERVKIMQALGALQQQLLDV